MTNDSHGAARGYGPFHQEAVPTDPQTPGSPAAPHSGAAPASGGYPASGEPYSAAYGGHPAGSTPAFGSHPTSGSPVSGTPHPSPAPTSGGFPASGVPSSGGGDYDEFGLGPSPVSGSRFGADPVPPDDFDRPVAADPYGLGGARPGPRIEPSPPPQRNRIIIGLIAGLLAGLVVFGASGFFLGRSTGGEAAPAPAPSTPASTGPTLGVYEQSQLDLNQAKLTGALGPISQDWLPYLSSCVRNGDPAGPALNKGEKTRVRCRFDGMSAIFVEYASVAERDKARVKTLGQNVDARTLTPGVATAGEKATPSGRTTGSYVEYAYTVTEDAGKQTVGGIWWDDAQTPVAAYMLAYWKDGLGENWAPMREVWARYA